MGDLLASPEVAQNCECRHHEADFVGDFNHRTGHLDAGFDPHGGHDEDSLALFLTTKRPSGHRFNHPPAVPSGILTRLGERRRRAGYRSPHLYPRPRHHPAPQQRQPEIETGRDHIEQHAFDVVLTWVGKQLQEDDHVRIHGLD